MKTLVIGKGTIGLELIKQIWKQGWEVSYCLTRNGLEDGAGNLVGDTNEYRNIKNIDIVFLCISTKDTGEKALEYIKYFTDKKIPVVTCEKGSLAYHFAELKNNISLIGPNASVGGGTRMLEYLKERVPSEIENIKGVVNGTLNFIWTELLKGKSPEAVVSDAIVKGYAEPGSTDVRDIVFAELRDVFMKTVIIANISGLFKESISLRDFDLPEIETLPTNTLLGFPEKYRCIVMISKVGEVDLVYGIQKQIGEWNLLAGFVELKNGEWLPQGVNNTLWIKEGENIFNVSGPGAGPLPTALSMISDARNYFI